LEVLSMASRVIWYFSSSLGTGGVGISIPLDVFIPT